MLTDLCQELHNWFDLEKHFGTFTITEEGLDVDFLQENQYFRIIGSVFNDGVWKAGDELTPETFSGAVWALGIPPAVLALSEEIDAWNTNYGAAAASPYQSESFGGYSYSKGTWSGTGPNTNTWQGAFASRLNRWRKI